MLLSEKERYVLECQVCHSTTPNKAPPIYLKDCVLYLKKLAEDGLALYKLDNGKIAIRLIKVDIDDDVTLMLFQYSNKDIGNPSFSEIETGKTRVERKRTGEGLSVSAHLCIKNTPSNKAFPHINDALLEEVHGLNRANVHAALTFFIRMSTNYSYKDPSTQKDVKCRAIVRIEYNANQNLKNLMSKGFVTGFRAIRTSSAAPLDEEGQLQIEEESLTLRVVKTAGDEALSLINKAIGKVKGREYSELAVRYVDENKRHKTLTLSTREQNIKEKVFAKSEKISLDTIIDQCEEEIHSELFQKMKEYLTK